MARGRHRHPDDDRFTGPEAALRLSWITAAFLAFLVGVFVLPIQFADGHHTRLAQEIERSGGEAYPVSEVRQKVERSRGGYDVAAQVAEYRSGGSTVTVRLHGYDQSAVVTEQEGWAVVPGGSADRAYVTDDGRHGFLAQDYRSALDREFDDLYRLADSWIGGWALVGLVTLTVLSVRRARRGATPPRRAALAPALYCAGAGALFALGYWISFPLAGGT